MSAFPLLRLPLVARENVLCMMTTYQLYRISRTSSKAQNAVAIFSKPKPRYWVHLEIDENPRILMRGTNKPWTYNYELPKDSFSNDIEKMIREWMTQFEYLRKVMGARIERIEFKLNLLPRFNKTIIDWLGSQQGSIEEVRIDGIWPFLYDNDVKYLISKIKVFGSLMLMEPTHSDKFKLEIPKGLRCLHVNDSEFIDYQQFLELGAREIVLHQSDLTNLDLNRFLKAWMSGESHFDLETLEINVAGPGAIQEIMDLPHEEANREMVGKLREVFPDNRIPNGFNIKRADGKVATVCLGDHYGKYRFCLMTN
uniref:F-box domain-containing protein n=1 Tax=Caenorhabditis tropicalis TaxID=1561998 RepID=A0A1I7TH94_9PELO